MKYRYYLTIKQVFTLTLRIKVVRDFAKKTA
jgi:hypothetical protein